MGMKMKHTAWGDFTAAPCPGAEDGEGSRSLFKGEAMAEFESGGELDAINHFGVSETLIGLFNDMREVGGISGNKFRNEDIDRLERAIVFRNYGKSSLELSHLIAAVLQLPPSRPRQSVLFDFFWLNQSFTPQRARAAFADVDGGADNRISVGEQFIDLCWGKDRFSISPSRISYLAALMEFVQYVEPQLVFEAEKQLAQPSEKTIRAFASWMQKKIFEFLNEHMIPAQLRRRLRHLIDWYKAHNDNVQTMEDFIDDAIVFQFWQQEAQDEEGLGFRKLSTVADDFTAILKALEIGRRARQAAGAVTIGMDVEAGELHPDQLMQACEESCMDQVDLKFLAKQLKFFPNSEWVKLCEDFIHRGSVCLKLPVTLMRMSVLGGLQDRLIQALKDKNTETFKSCLQGSTEQTYSSHLQQLQQFREEIQQAKLLGLGVFIQMESSEALALIAELLSPQALQQMQSVFVNGEDSAVDAEEFMQLLSGLRLEFPDLNRLCQQALEKFKNTNRAGFKSLPEQSALPEYSYGLEIIAECRRLRDAYIESLDDADSLDFEKDLAAFTDTLQSIYGDKL